MKILYLTVLTTLLFLGLSASAIAAKPAGPKHPTFDVVFYGDLAGSGGTKWQSDKQQDSITYFLVDQQGGTGELDMSYFQSPYPGGPFTDTRGVNCFDQLTPIDAIQFFRDKNGMAVLKGAFLGRSDDGQMTFMYHMTLKGIFDYPTDWLPQGSTSVTISSWKLKLKSKRENNLYSNITCTGNGSLATSIVVSKN